MPVDTSKKALSVRKPGPDAPLIVVVDDDVSVGRMLRMVLQRQYRVEVFTAAVEGVAAVRALRPGAVVLDIKMPDRDGFWAYDRIREFDPEVPIIFNSAYQDLNHPGDVAQSYPPFAYLQKDGDVGDFLHVVDKAVNRQPRGK